jgi:hypothetical protein
MGLSIWDIDGTIVSPVQFERNFSELEVVKHIKTSEVISSIRSLIRKQISQGENIEFVTGRKKGFTGEFTLKQLNFIKNPRITFMPDHFSYDDYYDYKLENIKRVINHNVSKNPSIRIIKIYDDNEDLLRILMGLKFPRKIRLFKADNGKLLKFN